MINIFKAVGAKIFGDLKSHAIKLGLQLRDEIIAMAKAFDLDGNGIKDHVQLKADLAKIADCGKRALVKLKEAGVIMAEAGGAGSDILKLGGLYYVKFGPQKPSAVVASLEQKADVA